MSIIIQKRIKEHLLSPTSGILIPRRMADSFLASVDLLVSIQDGAKILQIDQTKKQVILSWIMAGSPTPPSCEVCSTRSSIWHQDHFAKWCSIQCRNKHPDVIATAIESLKNIDQAAKQRKRRETTLKRYGVDHIHKIPGLSKEISKKSEASRKRIHGNDWAKDQYERTKSENGGFHPIDSNPSNRSSIEIKICEEIQKEFPGIRILSNDRSALSNKEIDIYLPDHNLGIECNGWWWHRENGPNKDVWNRRHIFEKQKIAEDVGIKILNFWDFETGGRFDQIMNLILSKIGCKERIFARKTEIRRINKETAVDFINSNHIQKIQINKIDEGFGLFIKGRNTLVSVMTIGKHPRQGSNKICVLNRFCSSRNVSVIGGASKLLSFAQKTMQFKEIISWSDNRFSDGNLYKKLGFTKDQESRPDYRYIDISTHKLSFKSMNTKKKLGARPDQTEWERAKEIGLDRLWDCGKIRWIKRFE